MFANKNVLVVGYPYAQAGTAGNAADIMFSDTFTMASDTQRTGRISEISTHLLNIVASKRLAPFTKANTVSIMRENILALRGAWSVRDAREQILPLVISLNVDVVAVAWGPYGKSIIGDIACRGIQALDVGRLFEKIKLTVAVSSFLQTIWF